MTKYKKFIHLSIDSVIKYLKDHRISKDDIVSLYHDGEYHILVYIIERE